MKPVWRFLLVTVAIAAAGCTAGNDQATTVVDFLADFASSEPRLETGLPEFNSMTIEELQTHGFSRRDGRLLGIGPASVVSFYTLQPHDRTLTFHFDPSGWYRRANPRVRVSINGQDLAELARNDMREAQTLPIPAELQAAGENELRFTYQTREGEIDELRARGVFTALDLAPEPVAARPELTDDDGADRLRLPAGGRQDYYVDLPADSMLEVDSVVGGDESALRVELVQDVGNPQVVELSPAPDRRTFAIRLSAGPTRVSLSASGTGEIAVGGGRVLTPERDPAPVREPVAAAEAETPNVLIYLIDTLRADHLGAYGYSLPTSPNIDRFAEDAIVFEAAQAQSSWTKPTVASMMTGLLPQQHGVQGRPDNLAPSARTIASELRLAGFVTFGVTTNSTVFADFNYDIGFHEYVELGEQPTPEVHQLSDKVNERFFGWLERRPQERPFFALLHTTDLHEPYMPRQPYRDQFVTDDLDPEIIKGPAARRALEADPSLDPDRLARHVASLYDAEIAFNDAQFGALVARLKELGLYDSTLIIVLSDHGEEFHEHGGWSHGLTMYQEVLHVPLLVKLPGQARAGERVSERAQHIDLFPTITEFIGLASPVESPGVNLLGLGQDGFGERPALSHLALGPIPQESVALGHRKFIRRVGPGSAIQTWLFNLRTDPDELSPLERPAQQGYLASLLKRAALEGAGAGGGQIILDPDMTERLRALGYIQ